MTTTPRRSGLNRVTGLTVLNHLCIALFTIISVAPMVLLVSVSLSSESAIKEYGYSFIPHEFSTLAYQMIFSKTSSVPRSYLVSGVTTVSGTLAAVVITGMAAFALVNKNVKKRDQLAFFFFIPMVFNAGLVPWYMMCRALHLRDNLWALIVPSLMFSSYNMFLCRNFMRGIPDALMESARLDGASDLTVAFRIYFPLSMPVLAAVTLFYGIAYWNDWFNAIMLVDDTKLYPLQYNLYKLQSEIAALKRLQPGVPVKKLPGEALKMATAAVTIGPIVLLYPFLQKYFVKGLVIGGVKG